MKHIARKGRGLFEVMNCNTGKTAIVARLLIDVSLVFLSICIGLAVLETALRLFYPQILNRQENMFVADDVLCFRMRNNFLGFHVDPEFSVKIKINSKGLRDREHDYQKNQNVYRILCLGDSFTFGNGVEAEQSYPKILESLLNKKKDGIIHMRSLMQA